MGPLGNVSGSNLIGVAIACGGNVLISLALTLQKLAHRRNEESVRNGHSSDDSADEDGSALGSGGSEEDEDPEDGEDDDQSVSKRRSSRGHVPSPIPEEDTPCPSPRRAFSNRMTTPTPNSSSSHSRPVVGSDNEPEQTSKLVDGENGVDLEVEVAGQTVTALPVVLAPSSPNHADGTIGSLESTPQPKRDAKNSSRIGGITKHRGKADGDRTGADADASADGEDSEAKTKTKPTVDEGMYLRSKLWWCGMILISIGEGGNFLSYGFAPASVVAPLGTVALIANCIFAPLILRERFHRRELVGMALAILGAVTVVWSSNGSNPRLDPSQLIAALKRVPFIIYTVLNLVLLSLLILLSNSSWGHRYLYVDLGITCLFGGYTVLSTKALSSLLSNDFVAAWESWITWVLVAVVAGTSVGQIRWLNRALMRFQSKEVIPTQFVFFSLSAIIGSAVLYQEFRDVPFSKFVNFAFGIGTTFLGVHLLTSTPNSDSETDTDESDHDDDEGLESSISQTQPRAQRASSSASVNLLIPSLSERTPLLVPTTTAAAPGPLPHIIPRVPTSPIYGALAVSPGAGGAGGYGRIRITKRTSTNEFTPTLGLGSQAGLLLMATTPPSVSSIGRSRSASRVGAVAQGQGDEERAAGMGTGTGRVKKRASIGALREEQ